MTYLSRARMLWARYKVLGISLLVLTISFALVFIWGVLVGKTGERPPIIIEMKQ